MVRMVAYLHDTTAWENLNCQMVIQQWHCILLSSCIQLYRHLHHSSFFLIFYLEAKYIEIIFERFYVQCTKVSVLRNYMGLTVLQFSSALLSMKIKFVNHQYGSIS